MDVRQTYQAFIDAKEELLRFKGSMKWKRTDSGVYLIRVMDSRGTEKSLGKIDAEKEKVFESFSSGKIQAQAVIELTASKFAHLPLRKSELKYFPNKVPSHSEFDFDL